MANCRRKTANLFDESTIQQGYYGTQTSYNVFTADNKYRSFTKNLKAGTYTLNINADETMYILRCNNDIDGSINVYNNPPYTFTLSADTTIYVSWRNTNTTNSFTNMTVMLNEGETALPYEPYWHHSLRKLGTATDTITTLPADLYADGNNATVGLVGNMSQTGTPTPQNPITPQETGERTGNLFYSSNNQTAGSTLHITQTIGNSNFILNKNESQTDTSANIDIDVTLPAGTYTLSVTGLNLYNNDYDRVFLRDDNSAIVVQNVQVNRPRSFTLTETTHIYRATVVAAAQSTYNNTTISIMLNTGSQPLPYEPYGYKIPISSANTTTNIYLGEVQTTRRIKKLVLTGEETYVSNTKNNEKSIFQAYMNLSPEGSRQPQDVICTHLPTEESAAWTSQRQGITMRSSASGIIFGIAFDVIGTTTSETAAQANTKLKEWLAQQYTNGTPVTVWYVLATETTGIVNEPIRKIGDYADTVSGISIPTITGADSFDVLTTLKPSKVSLAYTGWHDASAKEWDGSQWV